MKFKDLKSYTSYYCQIKGLPDVWIIKTGKLSDSRRFQGGIYGANTGAQTHPYYTPLLILSDDTNNNTNYELASLEDDLWLTALLCKWPGLSLSMDEQYGPQDILTVKNQVIQTYSVFN